MSELNKQVDDIVLLQYLSCLWVHVKVYLADAVAGVRAGSRRWSCCGAGGPLATSRATTRTTRWCCASWRGTARAWCCCMRPSACSGRCCGCAHPRGQLLGWAVGCAHGWGFFRQPVADAQISGGTRI